MAGSQKSDKELPMTQQFYFWVRRLSVNRKAGSWPWMDQSECSFLLDSGIGPEVVTYLRQHQSQALGKILNPDGAQEVSFSFFLC